MGGGGEGGTTHCPQGSGEGARSLREMEKAMRVGKNWNKIAEKREDQGNVEGGEGGRFEFGRKFGEGQDWRSTWGGEKKKKYLDEVTNCLIEQ